MSSPATEYFFNSAIKLEYHFNSEIVTVLVEPDHEGIQPPFFLSVMILLEPLIFLFLLLIFFFICPIFDIFWHLGYGDYIC